MCVYVFSQKTLCFCGLNSMRGPAKYIVDLVVIVGVTVISQVNTSHTVKCEAETIDLVLFAIFVAGPRVGWILAAKHPFAVSTNPLPAFQRGHSHTAPGEGCPHSSRLINTHSGRNTFLLN